MHAVIAISMPVDALVSAVPNKGAGIRSEYDQNQEIFTLYMQKSQIIRVRSRNPSIIIRTLPEGHLELKKIYIVCDM